MKIGRSLLLLLTAALLPLVALSAGLGAAWLNQQHEALEREALDRVDHIVDLVDRELAAQTTLLRLAAESPLLDGLPAGANLGAFREAAQRMLTDLPLWRVISVSDSGGNRLLDVPDLISGAKGRVVEEESHIRSIATGKPVIGGVRVGPRGRAAFAIRTPIMREGHLVGVVSAVIYPDGIRDLLTASGLPAGWTGAVVDAEGYLVALTNGPSSAIGQPAPESFLVQPAQGMRGLYEAQDIGGAPLVTAYRILGSAGWSVHIGIPRAQYRSPLQRSTLLLVGGGIASLALVGSLLWLLARELAARRREDAALAQSQRMEALGRMTGGVAHDFNNLLMIVQAGADLIRRRPDDSVRVAASLDGIVAAVQRGTTLTRQLLAFARRNTQEPTAFLLQARQSDLTDLLARSMRGDIEATVSIPNDCWPIFADPNGLEIALINLAVNARDAMPDGGRLLVAATNVTLPRPGEAAGLAGDFVAITVSDTGIGILPENLGRVFEPFFTTKPMGQGTGLGLAQVFGFAQQSGGSATVASKPGEGARFTLYLPRSRREPPAPLAVPLTVPEGDPADRGRLLLVEDNAGVARAIEAMLSASGYTVTCAASGAAALALLEKGERFDVVLSDVVMESGMSGIDLEERIRAGYKLPVVLMTGHSDQLLTERKPPAPVLTKPFQRADLLAMLRAVRRAPAPPGEPAVRNVIPWPR